MSPTGRAIHERILKESGFVAPVRIGILETPTGFEVNAIHAWPQRMEAFFTNSLRNFHPHITRIRAWRRDGEHSTNDTNIADAMLDQDYIYCGAGSPSYVIKHLGGTLAYQALLEAHTRGTVLCLGSATAVAISAYALPVYEIFKVGEDPHWLAGLDFFGQYGLRLAIVPHWNNKEGEDFDTTRCWMGRARFARLRALLPQGVIVLGIDEQTACIFESTAEIITVTGVGNAYILKSDTRKIIPSGRSFRFADLV